MMKYKLLLKSNLFIVLILSILIAFVSFPLLDPTFSSGLDESVPWIFNFFFNGNLSLAQDIVFPHGPLAFLLYPLPVGYNLVLYVIIYCLFNILFTITIFYLYQTQNKNSYAVPFLISLVFTSVLHLLFIIYGTILASFLIYFKTKEKKWVYLAIVVGAFSVYIKSYILILSALTTFSFLIIDYYKTRSLKSPLIIASIYVSTLVLLWLLMFGTLKGLINFWIGQYWLAGDNSAAAAYYPNNNWYLLSGAIILFLAIPLFFRDSKIILLYLLTLASIFAIWKYSMARQDYLHARSICYMLLIFFTLMLLIIERYKIKILILGSVIISLFYFNLMNTSNFRTLSINIVRVDYLYELVFNYTKATNYWNWLSQNNIAPNKLNDNIKSIVGNKTIDVYPWDYSYIPANNFKWKPRTVLHSYAAYNSWLDKKNAESYNSKTSPDYLIWHYVSSEKGINNSMFESIDNRYLLNDEPNTILSILNNYKLKLKTDKIMLFERTSKPQIGKSRIIKQQTAEWYKWIDVPDISKGILRAKTEINKNLKGKIKSFLFKDEEYYMFCKLSNGVTVRYKIVPNNAKDGLWINPLINHPENNLSEPKIKQIMFYCSNTKLTNPTIFINWEQTDVNTPHSNASSLFGKTKYTTDTLIYQANLTIPNQYLTIKPDGYSKSFWAKYDDLSNTAESDVLQINASLFVKSNKKTNAVLVISVDADNKNIYWQTTNIKDFIINESEWNWSSISRNIYKSSFSDKNLTLNIYLWNRGEDSISIKDFDVKIIQNKTFQ